MAEFIRPRPEGDGLKIIHAGLFRTGTKSIAQAYKILGYKTHHGLMEDVTESPWTLIEQAAEATWPFVPDARPRPPYKREDWDAIWGSKYDAVTDLASPFALELIKAYPNAKVVIVERDFESWWPSFKTQVLDGVMVPMATIYGWIGWYVMGIRAVQAMQKVHFGFYNARTKQEIYEHAQEKYEEYYREIRRLVPPERRLEYKLGDGWKPLCDFLNVELPPPGTPFPRLNDRDSHQEETAKRQKKFFVGVGKLALPCTIVASSVVMYYLF